jgi:hypothetical protein
MLIHERTFSDFIEVAEGVLAGTPRGLAFQNRLLGPGIIEALSGLGFSMYGALQIYYAGMLMLIFSSAYAFLRLLDTSTERALCMVAFFALALCGLQFYWFHVWDLMDLLIFTAFGYFAVSKTRLAVFVALFLLALLNRESAIFIAVYLMILAFFRSAGTSAPIPDMRWLLSGIALAIGGVVYTYLVRISLFVSLPDGGEDDKAQVLGNEVHTANNLTQFFWGNLSTPDIAVSISALWAVTWFGLAFRTLGRESKALYLTFLVVLGCILIFGIVVETRNFLILLPFVLFLYASTLQTSEAAVDDTATQRGRHM